jgi:hypothetical protein
MLYSLPFAQARIPVEGARLISRQGPRAGRRTWHNGVDLGGVPIGTPVYPIAPGVVDAICHDGSTRCCSYGNTVHIKHADDLFSLSAHLNDVRVTEGQEVGVDTILGGVGKTFRNRNAENCPLLPMVEHLHLEIQHDGYPFSPTDFAARYDVLGVLASSGIGVGEGNTPPLVQVVPFDYEDPTLTAALKSDLKYQEEVMGPALRYGRWYSVGIPFAIGAGFAGLSVLGIWLARKN